MVCLAFVKALIGFLQTNERIEKFIRVVQTLSPP